MKLGFVGLGKMGRRMVNKLLSEKHEIIVWNRSPGPCKNLLEECKKLDAGQEFVPRITIAEDPARSR